MASLSINNITAVEPVGLKHRSLDAGHCFTFWKVTVTINLAKVSQIDLADIANKVCSPCDAHQPVSRLICVEQTHNARYRAEVAKTKVWIK